jgi:hypothetical protein
MAGAMALTIVQKETAMIERVIAMSFGLAHVCHVKPSDHSVDLENWPGTGIALCRAQVTVFQ